MKYFNRSFIHGLLSFSLVAIPGVTYADDTSIYFNAEAVEGGTGRANLLFVIDNSGSMVNNDVVSSNESDFDSTTDYDPPDGETDYRDTDIYYVFKWVNGSRVLQGYLPLDKNTCKTLTDEVAEDGEYEGRIREHRLKYGNRRWRSLEFLSDNNYYIQNKVECKEDYSFHGETDADDKVYTIQNEDGWTSVASDGTNDMFGSRDTHIIVDGNKMNFYTYYLEEVSKTRLQTVIDVTKAMASNLSNVNVGLMVFNYNSGGRVESPVQNINTSRDSFKTAVDDVFEETYTPLSEVLWEAYAYMSGGDVYFGERDSTVYGRNGKNVSVASSRVDGDIDSMEYESPITLSCQPNHIIFLSDGEETSDGEADGFIENLTGEECSGNCMDELSGYMANYDISDLDGTQTITTHTIGFSLDHPLLSATAAAGGGVYKRADNYNELLAAFSEIVADIDVSDTTFVAPAVSVNSFNNLQHLDQIYYALFKPQPSTRWHGNLKRFRIDNNGDIKDYFDVNAIDPATGYFRSGAVSYWPEAGTLSGEGDGGDVQEGGVRNHLTTTRNLFTFTTGTDPLDISNVSLNVDAQKLQTANAAVTASMLGATVDATYRDTLLKWVRGQDTDDNDGDGSTVDASGYLPDPLHSQPTVITYGGTEDDPESLLFYGDNLGVLHAINTKTGDEVFGFLPPELLGNIESFYDDASTTDKVYGLDGRVSVWIKDVDNDGSIDTGDGDFVRVIIGMRRGGTSYYALDVSDVTFSNDGATVTANPKLMWQITGDPTPTLSALTSPASDRTAGRSDAEKSELNKLKELGQTWGTAQLGRVNWCDGADCDNRIVAFFTGGYDADQDSLTDPLDSNDSVGRALFMVDAETGEILWSAGNGAAHTENFATMTHSFPADLSLGDLNGDRLVDVAFAVDVAGKVWRFDFNKDTTGADDFLTSAGIIANLSGDNRKFFNRPDASYYSERGSSPYLIVALGSGNRPDPGSDDASDKFFAFTDPNASSAPDSYNYVEEEDADGNVISTSVITVDDLFDATSNTIQEGATADDRSTALTALGESHGWYISLDNGIKVLSDSVTVNNTLIFTTFNPAVDSGDPCAANVGSGQVWIVNATNATAVANIDGDTSTGDVSSNGNEGLERSVGLNHPGIPSSPAIIYTAPEVSVDVDGNETIEEGGEIVCVSTECLNSPDLDPLDKIFWRENQSDDL